MKYEVLIPSIVSELPPQVLNDPLISRCLSPGSNHRIETLPKNFPTLHLRVPSQTLFREFPLQGTTQTAGSELLSQRDGVDFIAKMNQLGHFSQVLFWRSLYQAACSCLLNPANTSRTKY